MNADIITFMLIYMLYVLLTQRIVRSAITTIKYLPTKGNLDLKIAFGISAVCWVYFVIITTIALANYLFQWSLPINIETFRNYTRYLGILLLSSTTYLILKVFPK